MAEQRISKIVIRRGNESRINELSLLHGELAITDTNKLYIGSESGMKIWLNTDRITAQKAEQLAIAKSFSIVGDGTAQAINFDGQDNVELNLVLAPSGVSSGVYSRVTVNSKGIITSTEELYPAHITDFLDGGNKIKDKYLPPIAITDTYVVNDEESMLELDAQKGDIVIREDIYKTFILKESPASTLANWHELKSPTNYVTVVNGQTGVVTLTPEDVGAEPAFSKNSAFNKSFGTLINDVKKNGTPSIGTKDEVARIDHVHGHDDTKADIDNPTFTGVVIVPDLDPASNDSKAANTKFVKDQGYATKTYVDELIGTEQAAINELEGMVEDKFSELEDSLLIIDGGTF